MLLLLQRLTTNRLERVRALLASSAIALTDQIVVSGLGFATSILIGRHSTELLGVYFLSLSIILFARGILESLIAAPFKVYCHRTAGDQLSLYAGNSVLHHCVLSLFVSLIILLAAWSPIGQFLPPGVQVALIPLAITWPLIALRELFRQLSFARLQFGNALIIDTCVAVAQLTGLYWLALTHHLSVTTAFSVISVACGGAAIGWLLTTNQRLATNRKTLGLHWKQNWSFGRWAVAAQLVGFIAPYMIPWVLTFTHGTLATGIFAACMTLVSASRVVTEAIFNLLTPKSAQVYHHGGPSALVQMLVQWGIVVGFLMGLFFVLILLCGEPLLIIIYGSQYAGTRFPLSVLALAFWIHTMGYTCGSGLYVLERTKENFWADLVSTLLTVLLSIPLIRFAGVSGAALAMLVALGSGAIARTLILRMCLKNHAPQEVATNA
jgi:O-antigen/teichoic acid export membrane protein